VFDINNLHPTDRDSEIPSKNPTYMFPFNRHDPDCTRQMNATNLVLAPQKQNALR